MTLQEFLFQSLSGLTLCLNSNHIGYQACTGRRFNPFQG